MIFNKPLFCFLSSTYLDIFDVNTNKQQRFSFSPEFVQHDEIVDEHKLQETLIQFISKLSLKKNNGVIVLSEDLVFSKEIDLSLKNEKNVMEEFLAAVPIAKTNIATIIIKNKLKLKIMAANKKLYEMIVSVLTQYNIAIFAISPITAFTKSSNNQELTITDAKEILKGKDLLKQYNFLESKKYIDSSQSVNQNNASLSETNKSMKKQYIILAFSLLLFGCAIIYLLIWSGTIKSPPSSTVSSKITIYKPTQIPTPTIKLIDKSLITIQILNGSGIEGEAGKLSGLLQEAGYKNITTGNTTIGEITSITYSKKLTKDIPEEIAATIKKDFPNVAIQEASESAQYDLVITTGKSSK